jgi:hypothetical protein
MIASVPALQVLKKSVKISICIESYCLDPIYSHYKIIEIAELNSSCKLGSN